MTTVYDDALAKLVQRYTNSPEGLECIAGYLRNLRNGYYDQESIDVVFQKFERFSEYTIEDAVGFMTVHAHIHLGDIAVTKLQFDCEPFGDKEVEENNAALQRNLEGLNAWGKPNYPNNVKATCKFFGKFWGGSADEDGYIDWEGKANFWIFKDGKCDKVIELEPRLSRVPLEVGYTNPGRTLTHLKLDRSLARWPYDSKTVTILAVINDDL